jgi:hypothetical protein
MTRRPRVTKAILGRLGRLLEMEYRPSEIAEVLGVHKDTIYRGWVPAGAPHRRDEAGNLWIVGTWLAAWLRDQMGTGLTASLADGEAYCMHCRRAVVMAPPLTRVAAQRAILVRGVCPQCGGGVARFESPKEMSDV